MVVTGPIASIIVSIIFSMTALFSLGVLTLEEPTYATVQFDGGYRKLGVIAAEEIFTEVSLMINGETLRSGSNEEIIKFLEKSSKSEGVESKNATLKAGVTISGKAGIKWNASESNFKLQTESVNLTSTNSAPLTFSYAISTLQEMESKAKSGRVETAKKSLHFGKAPTESFLLSKILGALRR
jgi:hypothetical protein